MHVGQELTIESIRQAAKALQGVTVMTPLQESVYINDLLGARVFFKLENLQRTGSFKLRGAYNRIRQLTPEELKRGVIAASAGNHAQGVALAAGLVGTTSLIYMPEGASLTKIESTRGYGADICLFGETFDDAYHEAERVAQETGRVLIPAFNDPAIIAGQGTIALEMLDERPHLDVLVVPVGGGGLIAGMALAAKEQNCRIKVIGVQTDSVPAFVLSRQEHHVVEAHGGRTIADGIAVKRPGDLTFELVEQYVDDVVTVSEHDISRAILIFLERTKLVVEGAGAVGLAAMLAGKIPLGLGTVGVVVSGGNIDVTLLNRIIEKGLVEEGRQVHLKTTVGDRPGQLARVLRRVAELKANVIRVEHERWNPQLSPAEVAIQMVLETRNVEHVQQLVTKLREDGYDVEILN
ncbi:threonine ammonia-lyase [Sulfobacillus thermosulfidooxidans]|uniref:L-threonine dehydratase catabolic TdcB n=1 Tax=Sulfobacillus thermosulfidooxidans (strain DSM 9293 / VKM B-1269 / AT-1) TaxID=929705 RepID=A0A1W1WAJ0_SULTA|nr:threonine ammonia-lyase [Sulfobacillus thermosulfidooxidans]OLZ11987.1 threonine ammonia-lyase [Sulfobacillus thermosulfidooxidans]OLZ17670.1 threonine ammonia-lyase [Sulfobacillus thermosulfidooxidans]OLZ22451.1 threonine ammonia-lyase [Sulfobacillus thermosulfidooxidans]SMC03222.1 threonine dehydratase [Sulfobacillus thermosulfidooxidans DSM 9293]